MPPTLARAIARVASVTVSIAADNMGIFNVMSLVSLLRMSTSRGSTCEKAGSNSTSSNVNPSPKNFEGDFDLTVGGFILAMCKGRAADKYGPNFYVHVWRICGQGAKTDLVILWQIRCRRSGPMLIPRAGMFCRAVS